MGSTPTSTAPSSTATRSNGPPVCSGRRGRIPWWRHRPPRRHSAPVPSRAPVPLPATSDDLMAESETTDVSPRGAARRARRQRLRRIATSVASVVMLALIVLTALVVTGAIELPGAGTTVQASDAPPDSTSTTAPRTTTHHRALTTDAPLRLWIAGDSLAGSVGPSLGQLTADTGVVAPQYDSRVSSGLLTPDFFDWPKHAQEQLAQLNPEAVVFVIGTNDANVWSPRLEADYRFRTEAMMRELVGKNHRTVYWVGPPVAKDSGLEEGVKAVDAIARETAAEV